MIVDNIARLVNEAYPNYGTLQDWDDAILEDGTVQYLLYFSNGGRAAYQTGWDFINMEREEDIPYVEK
jgi:hypothetical protein